MVKIIRDFESEQNKIVIAKEMEADIGNALMRKLKYHGLKFQKTYWSHRDIVKLKIPFWIFRISHSIAFCEEVCDIYQEGNKIFFKYTNTKYLNAIMQIAEELERENEAIATIETMNPEVLKWNR